MHGGNLKLRIYSLKFQTSNQVIVAGHFFGLNTAFYEAQRTRDRFKKVYLQNGILVWCKER
jgi:hypothetical protein